MSRKFHHVKIAVCCCLSTDRQIAQLVPACRQAGSTSLVYNIKMFVYALVNKQNRIYVWMSNSLTNRLKDHNYGRVFSTKGFRPWRILYQEECVDRKSARIREKYLKSGVGKEFLKIKLTPLQLSWQSTILVISRSAVQSCATALCNKIK